MATTIDVIRDRVTSICAGSLTFTAAVTPFDFTLQPTGQIDRVFRITTEAGTVIGGFNFTEERTDVLEIWLARKQALAPATTYRTLVTDVSSLRSAIVRDGATGGGDYTVPDQYSAFDVQHDEGKEYAVVRVAFGVNYEATL